ncbi:MAG: 7-carboxy-7-deazaguanine synthase [Betaproteobacteria bacterium]|nr:7-carboxy-7-deazaguanine synthase [Betaproteobacteria bacterium]NBT75919.1 7-carboxy-7-deazaguanine synthase [Betaproteobacteria bacterium]NBY14014.1 7-carboxy-7-deazaguanine synthase [Betaproteobacteria bacterium]NCA16652.1 7-carboxy-7-deazaguanine synthase [Betaproteobacteria bacterium]NDF03984.1 7-carboxy-7-deazaguanine synthase [Betaproteobacteria bacterium]
MGYRIKECFLTLQGEGAQTGRLSVFVRFSGCNNWSGRDVDRTKGPADCARWCDTDFVGIDGPGGGDFSADEVVVRVQSLWPKGQEAPHVVLTGGEPALQVDKALVDALHETGARLSIETNGSLPLPEGIDWICVSPKRTVGGDPQALVVRKGQELKLVLPQSGFEAKDLESLDFEHFFVQPMDGPDAEASLAFCMEWVRTYPRWKLSLQSHKILGIA